MNIYFREEHRGSLQHDFNARKLLLGSAKVQLKQRFSYKMMQNRPNNWVKVEKASLNNRYEMEMENFG